MTTRARPILQVQEEMLRLLYTVYSLWCWWWSGLDLWEWRGVDWRGRGSTSTPIHEVANPNSYLLKCSRGTLFLPLPAKSQNALDLRPGPRWGRLQRSPRPLAGGGSSGPSPILFPRPSGLTLNRPPLHLLKLNLTNTAVILVVLVMVLVV